MCGMCMHGRVQQPAAAAAAAAAAVTAAAAAANTSSSSSSRTSGNSSRLNQQPGSCTSNSSDGSISITIGTLPPADEGASSNKLWASATLPSHRRPGKNKFAKRGQALPFVPAIRAQEALRGSTCTGERVRELRIGSEGRCTGK